MQSSIRQKRILEALCEGRVAAHVLARRLSACVRTVYRDIRVLQAAGYGIGAASGRCGGFWLLPSSKPAPVHLSTAAVRKLLLLAAASTAGADLLEPLIQGLPPAEAIAARRVLDRIQVDRPVADLTALPDELLGDVWSAIASRRSVLLDGQLLSPNALVLAADGPVLVGVDAGHRELLRRLGDVRHSRCHLRPAQRKPGTAMTYDAQWSKVERSLRYLREPLRTR